MLGQRRILALWLPRLPTDRLTRKNRPPDASLGHGPLIVSGKSGNALYVYALEARAQRLGLYKGQPLADAQAMVQPLAIAAADEKADAALLENIADWCDRFTPLVTVDGADGLYLDITGAAHLFGGEAAMLALVQRKIAAQGFAVQGAIAGTSLAARVLARHAPATIAAPGGEAAAVAPLPIAALDCDEKSLRALRHAGLESIGMVAARLSSELAERLGAGFVTRLRVILGASSRPLTPRRPPPDLMAEQHFAEPATAQTAIAAALRSLAENLSAMLERQGRGARVLEAIFFRADGALRRIAVRSGETLRDPTVMLRLLNQKLDTLADPLDPGFGFDVIRLEALLAQETSPATLSFDSGENARRQVALLLDRLSVRFGAHRVLRFLPQDTHIPEAAAAPAPAQDRDCGGVWTVCRQGGDPPLRPLRLLEKPEEIFHVVASVPDGPPSRFRWRQVLHDVTRCEGPERIAMEWWRQGSERHGGPKNPSGPARDYFRVETHQGQRFWLYRDGPQAQRPKWYLQGIFS